MLVNISVDSRPTLYRAVAVAMPRRIGTWNLVHTGDGSIPHPRCCFSSCYVWRRFSTICCFSKNCLNAHLSVFFRRTAANPNAAPKRQPTRGVMRAALRGKHVCRGTGSVGAFSLGYFASSRRGFTSSISQPHVCVVGAGPAGFYTIEYLLKSLPDAKIDLYERWPCPYGLVRFGVAPDHPGIVRFVIFASHGMLTNYQSPEVKVVANKFEKFVTDNPQRVQFVGLVGALFPSSADKSCFLLN